MALLFHQNMRDFGGGVAARNVDYQAGFAAVNGAMPPGPLLAAGFTEILNHGAAVDQLSGANGGLNLCNAIGTWFRGCIAVGRMAVSNTIEYIGIGTTPLWLSAGRVLIDASGRGGATRLRLDCVGPGIGLAAFNHWCQTLPEYATLDYRGIAYMVINNAGVDIAVGFLHNIYAVNDARSVIVQRLADAADLIMNNDPAQPDMVYIGGDFNVAPAIRNNRAGTTMTPYSLGSVAPPVPPPAPLPPGMLSPAQAGMQDAHAGGTLLTGSLYDYWYWNGPLAPPPPGYLNPPVAHIDTRTCQRKPPDGAIVPGTPGTLSDHMASYLQI